MLRSLSIRNYILIDSLEVSFPEGLCIVTGQTGAGKSILLGALSLLTGAKADATQISAGADNCVVEGEFSLKGDDLQPIFEENGVEWDSDSILIRRVLARSGRSRCFVNDCPVPIGFLSSIASHLVDIHSQHQTAVLTDKRFQLSLLDNFAGNTDALKDCADAYKALSALLKDLAETKEKLERISTERDYISAQFRQLEDARLREGELAELEIEQSQLANAESIKESLGGIEQLFDPDEGLGVEASLKEASRLLDRVVPFVPELADISDRLRSARIEISDLAETISAQNEKISISRERLEQVEERMSLLYSLLKKFSCADEAELIAKRDDYSSQLFDSTALEDKITSLEKQINTAQKKYEDICATLHTAREKAAPAFSSRIRTMLRSLELDRAAFEVEVQQAEPNASGSDAVCYLFDAAGVRPADVAKCASGGERSRIMLCLKAVMAEFTGMPTMIFDEIDTGVSGSAADAMGTLICDMGRNMQVIAITHLPQVAAKGNAHFVVEKTDTTTLRRVEGEERVREIARLLSGADITPEAIANAKSLLNKA